MDKKEKDIIISSKNSFEAWKRLTHEVGGLWDINYVDEMYEIITLLKERR